MNEQRFEVNARRHPIKSGEFLDTPEGKKMDLPFEGILQAQQAGVEFANKIKIGDPKSVIMSYKSNQARTGAAAEIFDYELQVAAKSMPGSKVFNRETEGSLEKISAQVDDQTKQIIIVSAPEHKVAGTRSTWRMSEIEKDTKGGMTENEILIKWLEDKETQERYGITPEEIASDFKEFIKDQTDNVQKLFPGRPVVITNFGHAFETDAAIFSLMKKDSFKQAFDKGGMIGTLEGAKVTIDESGKGKIEYRGIEDEIEIKK